MKLNEEEKQPLNDNKLKQNNEEKRSNHETPHKENLALKRAKTAVLGFGLFTVGSSYGTFNTALPDLKDLYETSTANLSLLFAVTSVGRLSMGMLMGAGYVSLNNPFKWFFSSLLMLSAMLALVPFVGHWQILIPVNFAMGQANAVIYAGSTAYCLQLWRESNSEPYMHYLHFMETCGFLFGPTLGTLVLPDADGNAKLQILPGTPAVKSYFFLMALIYQIVTPMYLYFAIRHSENNCSDKDDTDDVKEKKGKIFYFLLSVFGFLFFLGSVSWSVGMLLTSFAASPETGMILTRVQGAKLYLIFFASMTIARLVAVYVSTRIKASKTVYISLFEMMLSCTAIVYRQSCMNFLELMVYIAIMGLGVGPLYSQTLMTLEELTPIDKRGNGILYVYYAIGFVFVPWGLGQVADEYPYLLFLLCATATVMLLIIFSILGMFQGHIRKYLAKSR